MPAHNPLVPSVALIQLKCPADSSVELILTGDTGDSQGQRDTFGSFCAYFFPTALFMCHYLNNSYSGIGKFRKDYSATSSLSRSKWGLF